MMLTMVPLQTWAEETDQGPSVNTSEFGDRIKQVSDLTEAVLKPFEPGWNAFSPVPTRREFL